MTITDYIAQNPLFTRQEASEAGFDKHHVAKAVADGILTKAARGYYAKADLEFCNELPLAVACKSTGGVVYAASAGQYHQLTDDIPYTITIIRPEDNRGKFKLDGIEIDVRRTRKEKNLSHGVLDVEAHGLRFRITDKPRTVVDLFRFGGVRQHAVESVRAYVASGASIQELQDMAKEFGLSDEISLMAEATIAAFERSPTF
jgi:predicted transcriptional regulator of viral defense system